MSFKSILMGCAALVLLAGCTAPSLIHVNDAGVSAASQYPEYVTDIRKRTNANGLMEAQITFQSPRTRTIHYKIEWLDNQGYSLRNPIDERYRALRLTRNESYILDKLATDKRAQDIKVHIK